MGKSILPYGPDFSFTRCRNVVSKSDRRECDLKLRQEFDAQLLFTDEVIVGKNHNFLGSKFLFKLSSSLQVHQQMLVYL